MKQTTLSTHFMASGVFDNVIKGCAKSNPQQWTPWAWGAPETFRKEPCESGENYVAHASPLVALGYFREWSHVVYACAKGGDELPFTALGADRHFVADIDAAGFHERQKCASQEEIETECKTWNEAAPNLRDDVKSQLLGFLGDGRLFISLVVGRPNSEPEFGETKEYSILNHTANPWQGGGIFDRQFTGSSFSISKAQEYG